MKRFFGASAVLFLAGAAAACSSQDPVQGATNGTAGAGNSGGSSGTGMNNPVSNAFVPTAEQTLAYMRYLGPALLGRVLTDVEEVEINAKAHGAVKPLLESWVSEAGFPEAIRGMMEIRLSTNGVRGTTDYNLAGYLIRHVVTNKMPWSTILTSSTCYDAADQAVPCDTGAPFTAGVLTTRGFLAGNESRFNLNRARSALLTFMCRDYPHEIELQPPIDRPRLKLMFRAANAEEQMVAEVAGGFGNGLACFSCHSQFSNHAQPFVKFDGGGNYVASATGVQAPAPSQLGEAEGGHGLMASHLENPAESASEKAQWFGVEVDNLAGGAAVMAKHDKFRECAVQQLLDMGVGLDLGFPTGQNGLFVVPGFLTEIASSVSAKNPDPTIQELAVAAFSDVRVVATTLNGLKR